jgi:ketol-acid reductoisomerase
MNFGGVEEEVVTREELGPEQARATLEGRTVAVLGYGVQGPAQAKNLRDSGFQVIVGQRRPSPNWDRAAADGWIEGETLFSLEDACSRGDIVLYLLSDAGQISAWPAVRERLAPGDTLVFSHGFGVTYSDQTGIAPPPGVDVVLVAPKGSGTSVRRLFKKGRGINSSFAVHRDESGRARETVLALGIGIGSGYLFETSFENEVYSDLTGERGVLMGALAGLMEAQYRVLRRNGHTPSEAFNETVEELTQSLMPLVAENGMDWMYANCSTTAQRGALDWRERFRDAVAPVFDDLYESLRSGREAAITIDANGRPDYRERLAAELAELGESEIWRAGAAVRKLRP